MEIKVFKKSSHSKVAIQEKQAMWNIVFPTEI